MSQIRCEKFEGEILEGKRGYFICIYTPNVYSHLIQRAWITQKQVKRYELQFNLTGQELANKLASLTDHLTENNGICNACIVA